MAALESGGAFAIRFDPVDRFSSVRIDAYKGKSGPCYDTGRRAAYAGGAAAALDDDRHLIVGNIRVCEKTGGLYSLQPYRGLLSVTAAEPALLARLECDPVLFDCDTFDADSRRLLEKMANAPRSTGDVPVLYPGPFRLLVLADGSVVRRGVAVRVAAGVQTFRGPLLLMAGLLLTGQFRFPSHRAPVSGQGVGAGRLLLMGGAVGALWCPTGAGLFAGVVLPAALSRGTPMWSALFYGAGYALALGVVVCLLSAGGRSTAASATGRMLCPVAGWLLVAQGLMVSLA